VKPVSSCSGLVLGVVFALKVSGGESVTVSFGGQIRQGYEIFRNPAWGAGVADHNGHWLQRYMINTDLRVGEFTRAQVELKSGFEHGRAAGPRPTDEDHLDLHQAWFDLRWRTGADCALTLRVGRQELVFGSSRLISRRDGPNVRLSFDALRGWWQDERKRIDVFAAAPVETNPGIFDDGYERGQRLWGIYAVVPTPHLFGLNVDAYYVGFRENDAVFNQGVAREERHTVGLRFWGKRGAWDHNLEIAYQFGDFGPGRISAWTIASDTGFVWTNAFLQPRLGVKANISSGDHDPLSVDLQTFNPLFPRGAYFSESGLVGPVNLIDLHPSLDLHPHPTVTVSVDVDFYWRTSSHDGLYGPGVNLLRAGEGSSSTTIGHHIAVKTLWRPKPQWSFHVSVSRFFAGEFIRESGPGADVDYASAWVVYDF
jgi:hypothetical protein